MRIGASNHITGAEEGVGCRGRPRSEGAAGSEQVDTGIKGAQATAACLLKQAPLVTLKTGLDLLTQ